MIYRNSGEVSGQPPLNFKNYSGSIQDYLIEGNTSQNSTPTPDNPVDVVGCGERTRNLFDYQTMEGTIKGYYLDNNGNLQESRLAAVTDYIPCNGGKFNLAKIGGVSASICLYDNNKHFLYGQSYNTPSGTDKRTIVVNSSVNASYIRFTYFYAEAPQDDLSVIMLNSGTTPIPYEPYGYKIPISSGGENLFDATIEQGTVTTSGNIPANNRVRTKEFVNVESNYLTLSWDSSQNTEAYTMMYDANGDYVSGVNWRVSPITYQLSSTIKKIRIIWRYKSQADISPSAITNIMLNTGSIPLPYKPYNRITTTIYLGQAPTTRRIKKLVLTGEEAWTASQVSGNVATCRFYVASGESLATSIIASTHFPYINDDSDVIHARAARTNGRIYLFVDASIDSATALKAYLAAQYSAGTPVTIWYVLATPETAVVNEPLHKIGDYADTISKSQSNLPIPTISGQNTLTIPTTISPSNVSLTLDQKEIEKIYEGGKKEVELSGVPPISFNAIGSQLEDYLIEGNTSQNGTPSPKVPIDVQGCGERTENLYNSSETQWELGILDDQGHNTGATTSHFTKNLTRVSPNTNYFLSGTIFVGQDGHRIYFYDNSKNWISRSVLISYTDGSFTTPSNCAYIQIQVIVGVISTSDWMLNTGSTALPYEPYGYKLPSTINGTEYPIYLGQVPTTRRIRKLVFNGTENWIDSPASNGRRFLIGVNDGVQSDLAVGIKSYCSHFQIVATGYTFKEDNSYTISANLEFICRIDSSYTLETFKQWLTAQYVNGTPVTVWYVLATPETGIVNEPLHKIGNYADSISKSQSNLPIPITTGSNTLSIETTIQPSNITINYNKQTEIAEVYGGIGENYPIYYMNRTIEGTSPIMFKGLGKDLKDYTILGDTSQNGTPTPEAPVDVTGCGVRTKNLLDNQMSAEVSTRGVTYTKNADGSVKMFGTASPTVSYCILMGAGARDNSISNFSVPIFKAGDSLIFSTGSWVTLQARYTDGTYYNNIPNNQVITLAKNIGLFYVQVDTNATINRTVYPMIRHADISDSTYEPYGYVLPPTVNDTEYPIYLGQVPTTRRIKKLVLTGDEGWQVQKNLWRNDTALFALQQSKAQIGEMTNRPSVNTHFISVEAGVNPQGQDYVCSGYNPADVFSNFYYIRLDFATIGITLETTEADAITAFKSYLAAQYAAGTPVTVWYVLAEPETAVVNEPLMKIGDYADTITMSQSGVMIPTVAGSNVLDMTSPVKPSAVSITGNIKPTGYGQLLDVNNVDIQDKNNTPIFIHE